jgi:polyphosphate kinase
LQLITKEVQNAKAGKKAYILAKMNSLVDEEMIDKLYVASQSGVKIKLIIRGICCLVPGVKGLSENIEVVSIVDKFLEHSRIFIFGNGGDELFYIASADWMSRNLDHRSEVAVPIYDKRLKNQIREFIMLQLSDNCKARIIDREQTNQYVRQTGKPAYRFQEEFPKSLLRS